MSFWSSVNISTLEQGAPDLQDAACAGVEGSTRELEVPPVEVVSRK
jgi:hypothetical protein